MTAAPANPQEGVAASASGHAQGGVAAPPAGEQAFRARRVPVRSCLLPRCRVRSPPSASGPLTCRRGVCQDFARLHALEEARVARWKRQNKKTVTVPLAFRLAPDPSKVNREAGAAGAAAAAGPAAAAAELDARGKSVPGGAGERGGLVTGGKGARDHGSQQQKENHAVQSNRVGAPSEQMLYPAAFNRNARSAKRDSHVSVSSRHGGQEHGDRPISSGGSLRPLSTRDVSSALASAYPAATQHKLPGRDPAADAALASGLRAHRDPAAAGPGGVERAQHAHKSETQPAQPQSARRAAANERLPQPPSSAAAANDSERRGRGHEDGAVPRGPHVGAAAPDQEDAVRSPGSAGSTLSAIVAQEGAQKADPAQLRQLLGKLPTTHTETLIQPFSSLEFYHFGKTLGEGAYGKVCMCVCTCARACMLFLPHSDILAFALALVLSCTALSLARSLFFFLCLSLTRSLL